MGGCYYGQTVSEAENTEIEPSARTSDPKSPAVQPVNAIDDSISAVTILPGGQDVNGQAVSPDSSLGAAADGVLQGGLVLPTAVSDTVSDVRNVRQAIGSNQDIVNRANQRIAQDLQARREAVNPLLSRFPSADEVRSGQTGRDNRLVLPGNEQNNAAPESEADVSTEQIVSDDNIRRYQGTVDGVFTGALPTGSDIVLGKTPSILTEYGAPDLDLHMKQSVARKIAYPSGYMGGKHNLGLSALKNLPYQIADPIAIIENPQSNSRGLSSKIILTEWTDIEGKPVIVPVHLNAHGAIDVQNEIASAFGADYINRIIGENGENVLYTKNGEDIKQLLSKGRPLPQAMADDVLAKNSILPGGQDVNGQAVSPDSSVGAAPAGFDAYGRLIGKYGASEPGGNPAPRSYVVKVPRQTTPNGRASLSVWQADCSYKMRHIVKS